MKNGRIVLAVMLLAVLLTAAGTAAADEWVCPNCGQAGNIGNFCSNCGTAAPAAGWICPNCGQTGNTGNFCINCGAAKEGGGNASAVNQNLEQIPGQTDRVKVCIDSVDASSYIQNAQEPSRWSPVNVADGDESTCWQFSWKKNQWLVLYLSEAQRVDEVWFKNGFWAVNDKGKDQYSINARWKKIKVEYLYSGESAYRDAAEWTLQDSRDAWLSFATGHTEPVVAIRFTILSTYQGSYYKNDVCLSEVMPVQYAPSSSAKPASAAKAPRIYESRPNVTGVSLKMKLATRSGPGTQYYEPGTFFGSNWQNATVRVLKKSYVGGVWWVQVDFDYGSMGKYRVWTGLKRVDVDLNKVPEEGSLGNGNISPTSETYYGPGGNYARANVSITQDAEMIIYGRENGFLDVEYWYIYSTDKVNRIWVPESVCYGIYWGNDNSGEN